MGCPPVRGDNPRALASGLSYVQVDKHGITILYHLHHCRHAHHAIFRAKVGNGGIRIVSPLTSLEYPNGISYKYQRNDRI